MPVSDNQKAAGKVAANAAEIAMQTKANRIKRFLPDEALNLILNYRVTKLKKPLKM
ncbi:hypothetical protein P4S63_18495 [Pseudoalteromonas sp. B193]